MARSADHDWAGPSLNEISRAQASIARKHAPLFARTFVAMAGGPPDQQQQPDNDVIVPVSLDVIPNGWCALTEPAELRLSFVSRRALSGVRWTVNYLVDMSENRGAATKVGEAADVKTYSEGQSASIELSAAFDALKAFPRNALLNLATLEILAVAEGAASANEEKELLRLPVLAQVRQTLLRTFTPRHRTCPITFPFPASRRMACPLPPNGLTHLPLSFANTTIKRSLSTDRVGPMRRSSESS